MGRILIPGNTAQADAPSDGGGVFARPAGEAARQAGAVAGLRRDVVSYLQRKGQPLGDAEDAVQEAFVRFHRAGHDLSSPDARPLLFVIARNIQNDRWKAAAREARRLAAEDVTTLDAGPRAIASDERAADDRLIGRQNLAAAAAVIRRLPQRTREAFLMHRFENQTYRQIAAKLGVSVSMVEKYIAEALRQLKISAED